MSIHHEFFYGKIMENSCQNQFIKLIRSGFV